MNNLSFGGFDSSRRRPFAYYETIAGGMGAGPEHDGHSADTYAHDEQLEHAGGGAGASAAVAHPRVQHPARIGRFRRAARRRRHRARMGVPGAGESDAAIGPAAARSLRASRRAPGAPGSNTLIRRGKTN